jgi:hypothetical protein
MKLPMYTVYIISPKKKSVRTILDNLKLLLLVPILYGIWFRSPYAGRALPKFLDEERSLVGTWFTEELKKVAESMGYEITKV